MVISVTGLIFILLIHFLADFCLQTSDQATQKSTNVHALFRHCLTYSLVWLVAGYCIFDNVYAGFIFFAITLPCHFITDFITSRLGKPLWESKNYHDGFVMVGADQVLHYIQLILTYIFISKLY